MSEETALTFPPRDEEGEGPVDSVQLGVDSATSKETVTLHPWIIREEVPLRRASTNRSLTISERCFILALGDSLVVMGTAVILGKAHMGPSTYVASAIALAVGWLAVGHFAGLYDMARVTQVRPCLMSVARTAAIVFGILLLAFYLHPTNHRGSVIALALAAPTAIAVWRVLYIRFADRQVFQRRVLILGAGASSGALVRAIHRHQGHGISVVGILDDDLSKHKMRVDNVPVLGSCSQVWDVVNELEAEEVVLGIGNPTSEELLKGLGICYEHGIPVSLMPQVYEEVTGQVPVEYVGQHWPGAFPLRRPGGNLYAALKRGMDIAVSAPALLLASPLMLVTAVLVRLSSPGPIFFRQMRCGLHGRPFSVVKFRTMYADAGQWGQALGDTSDRGRVTPVGKWLRRMYLDELPQLWLILRGDMSLVGPRPKRLDQARELERCVPLWRAKYSVRPGLTGWGQIQYGYASSADEEMARLRYDLYYVRHCSPLLDMSILVRTGLRVLRLKGF